MTTRWYDSDNVVDPEMYTLDGYPRHFWLSLDRGDTFTLNNIDEYSKAPGVPRSGAICARPGSHEITFLYEEFFKPTHRSDVGLNSGIFSVRRVLVTEKQDFVAKLKTATGVSALYTLKNHEDDVLTGNSYLMAMNRQSAYVIYDITKDIAFRENCLLLGEFPKI